MGFAWEKSPRILDRPTAASMLQSTQEHYSHRNATIGSTRDALRAGR